MSKDYQIRFTKLATEFAKVKLSLAGVEEVARRELAQFMEKGQTINNLILHTFKVNDTEFICYPKGENIIEIDTCSREKGPKLDKGPFKGFTVELPTPDSE